MIYLILKWSKFETRNETKPTPKKSKVPTRNQTPQTSHDGTNTKTKRLRFQAHKTRYGPNKEA